MKGKASKPWSSKFARFVQDFGVESLALELDVRPSAIDLALVQNLFSEGGRP